MTYDDNYANDNDCNNTKTASESSANVNSGGKKNTGKCNNWLGAAYDAVRGSDLHLRVNE